MRKNILNKLIIAACLLVMVSCKAKKLVVADKSVDAVPVVNDVASASVAVASVATGKPDERMNAIKAAQLTFNTFSARAAAKLDIDGSKQDATLNIRINRDKEIWVSVSVTVLLTVEVARAVITPDSIQVINKIDGTYLKKPFSYIYQYANDQVNYKMLESLLVGNAIPEILNDNNAGFKKNDAAVTVYGALNELVYQLMLNADMKVGQFNLSNHNQGQSLQVNNNLFIPVNSRVIPSQIDIQSESQNKKNQINLHYTKVDLDQSLVYPFNIPASYKPADGN